MSVNYVATEIVNQLGGLGRLRCMLGTKKCYGDGDAVVFDVPVVHRGLYVKVSL
jgi:hypothetical protein